MNNTVNVPPRRKVESHIAWVAVNVMDRNDRLTIIADTETHAKVELIDKLGYIVDTVSKESDSGFKLVDADTHELKAYLESASYEGALDEVLKAARWQIQEPMDMVGGSLGQGYEEVDDE